MKLQEFTELLTKPLMIKMETTDIPCASVVHRQQACIGIYSGLANVFEQSKLAHRMSILPSGCPNPMRWPKGNPSMRHTGMFA